MLLHESRLHFFLLQNMDSPGFPWWLSGKESACNAGDTGQWVPSLGREDPLEEGMAPTPVFLTGESHGLAGYSP